MGGRDMNARAYLSRFNFTGADQEKLIGVLSGGERNRLHLAMALKEEGNVLLLDEPTNDIDVNTLRALEEGLENFAGCAVVISHDRWFSTVSVPIYLLSKAIRKCSISKVLIRNTRKIRKSVWAMWNHIGYVIANLWNDQFVFYRRSGEPTGGLAVSLL